MPPAAASSHRQDPGLVAVIAYDGLCTFEFGIAVEVFGLPRPEFDFSWYRFKVVSAEGRRSRAIGGIVVEAGAPLSRLKDARTIIVPGWRDRTERPPERLLRAISQAAARGARCLSICSGVFVLAAAGLLDGKRATTHWRHIPDLKRLYPRIQVEEDTLYVDEGNVITSAGSAAGIDACLHLVRRDFGSKVANTVARRLVMPPHRDGGQAQYVVAPVQARPGRTIGEVMDWARARLAQPIAISAMAKRAGMSERTLLRSFKDSTGASPAAWLQQERMARARELLETATLSLADISAQCGYRSLETFRVAFRRIVGTSPAAYRRRFEARPTSASVARSSHQRVAR
ncbi:MULTISPECIES: transcriptional regulator FtrA [unclassified Bradyrhizobium]|uniref:transcriptional regulator FtrA n=1 Tax=unclassified Bradyrhizobium TaxID=2631580 RepID=UPI002916FEA6|nr:MULTISPECIES: transcriptional regulator FtrA [unclassified Bradyrhizobium]